GVVSMAGGARRPLALVEAEGGHQGGHGDRDRARANEPKPEEGLGDPPPGMDESEVARWNELKDIAAPGVLTKQDRPGAEFFCKLWAESRRRKLNKAENQMLYALMGKFGLTPADRSKVQVTPTKGGPAPTGLSRFKRNAQDRPAR
ncbi:MAG TPA: hypothetical protein PKA65_13190, partial [Solirubrobacterales bacterium]|nr:hypothetical protein [Solirubrobacterales bacterium]